MSCPTCGTTGTCAKCSKSSSWGNAFDSWGSSSGEWGQAGGGSSGEGARSGGGVATAEPPVSSWLAQRGEQSASDGWGAPATPPASLSKPSIAQDETDGRASPSAVAPAAPKLTPQEDPEPEQGWWTPEPSAPSPKSFLDESYEDDLPLQPIAAQWAEGEDEEAWLDETEDHTEPAPGPHTPSSGNTMTWLAIAATGVMMVGGLMFLQKPTSPTAAPATLSKTDQKMETLQNGRRLIIAGRITLRGDKAKGLRADAEAATYQLAAGIKDLQKGGASPREVGGAKALLATSYWNSRNWEEAYKTWGGLAAVPEYKAEANAGKAKAKGKLLAMADNHLQNSSGSLRANQYGQSIAQANEALRLMDAYGGAASKKGTTHGNIGFAEMNLGHRSAALIHFNKAFKLSGNYIYADQAYALAPSEPVETASVAVAQPVVLNATIPTDPLYPNGVSGPHVPSTTSQSQPVAPQPVASTPTRPTNTTPVFIPKPKPGKKPRPNNTFDTTDHSRK